MGDDKDELVDPEWDPEGFKSDEEEEDLREQLRDAIKKHGGIPQPQSFLPLKETGKSYDKLIQGFEQRLGLPIHIIPSESIESPRPSVAHIPSTPKSKERLKKALEDTQNIAKLSFKTGYPEGVIGWNVNTRQQTLQNMASSAQFAIQLLSENERLRETAVEVEAERDALLAKVAALKKVKRALESKLINRDHAIAQHRNEIKQLQNQNFDISKAVSKIADALNGLTITQ